MAEDLRSFFSTSGLSRREFVVTTIGAGFALAVQPARAEAIKTNTTGLVAGAVKIPVSDGQMPGYRARPASGQRFPIVLVVQEIFGVHEYIQDVCRRFAKLGYLAVAPELYARQGDVSRMTDMNEVTKVVAKVPDSQVLSDLDAAASWASKSEPGDANKLGITGFCWGGRIVWLYAAHNPKLKAGVAWYGRLEGDKNPLTPRNPIDLAGALKAPVIGFYGAKDTGISQDSVEKMRASLRVVNDPS